MKSKQYAGEKRLFSKNDWVYYLHYFKLNACSHTHSICPKRNSSFGPAGVALLIECCPMHPEVAGLILVREHTWFMGFIPTRGLAGDNWLKFLSYWCFYLFSPLSLKSITTYLKKIKKNSFKSFPHFPRNPKFQVFWFPPLFKFYEELVCTIQFNFLLFGMPIIILSAHLMF